MVTTLPAPAKPAPATSWTCPERRDATTRALRAAVAAWFGLHPSELAGLGVDTIDRMALRLEGRRVRRPLDAADASAVPPVGHPWAG